MPRAPMQGQADEGIRRGPGDRPPKTRYDEEANSADLIDYR